MFCSTLLSRSKRTLHKLIGRFRLNHEGAIHVLVGIAMIPLLACAGLAIDVSRGYLIKARLSEAVDAAALAGAGSLHLDVWQEDVNRYFAANFADGYLNSDDLSIAMTQNHADQSIEVIAQVIVPTTFLRLIKVNEFTVSSRTVVSGERRGLELALVLDVTGSMSGSKLAALKEAASNLLTILYGGNETLDDLYISVVPFAGRVNHDRDDWMTSTPWYYQGCGEPRSGANATDDSPPSEEAFDPYWNGYYGWWYPAYGCPSAEVLPLTAEKSTVQAAINGLSAGGNTRTDIGMAWGWRVLSPQWRGLWGDASLPMDYDRPLMDKAVIIMTDGENTPWLSGDSESESDTNALLQTTCTGMKEAGITVFTINFQTPPSLDSVYEACASEAGNHFASPTTADLNAAFQAIAAQLSNLRIIE